jgi:acyl-coenzyme A synthetase/AMP-(fatty) acid ligase
MNTSALLSHDSPGAVLAYRGGAPLTAGHFLAEAEHLAAGLPPGRHVLNLCTDRYHFTVAFAACLLAGKVSLLPSTHTTEMIAQLLKFAPDAFCLTDDGGCRVALPRVDYAGRFDGFTPPAPGSSGVLRAPRIPDEQLAAIVFTSGSTGAPIPYRKTWGRLVRCVRAGAARLELLAGARHTLVGTVPAQHMYGFESTVLLALQSGNALTAERPFYPADVCAAIDAAPRPRALVSTPVHLRTLVAAGFGLPPLDLILSATAPLSAELARSAELKFQGRLIEIYGSTETGQIATRRTAEATRWQLWPDVHLTGDGDTTFAAGGHIEQRTALCDVIEILGEHEFLLLGRTVDLVNLAGKRSSFGYLNAQLNAIPGVVDGVFFSSAPADEHAGFTGVTRLAAAVVAPGLSAAGLIDQLRERIDPVFLPRPLLMVERLPRNATGKLPLEALQALAREYARQRGSSCN